MGRVQTAGVILAAVVCGSCNGKQASDLIESQNRRVDAVVERFETAFVAFDQLYVEQKGITIFDEITGARWLDFMKQEFLPAIEIGVGELAALKAEEDELVARVNGKAGVSAKPIPGIIEFAVVTVGLYVLFSEYADRMVGRVKTVEDKIAQGRAAGKTQAQAMGGASPQFLKAYGDTVRDIQGFVVQNNYATTVLMEAVLEVKPCVKAVLETRDNASNFIEARKRLLALKRKRMPKTAQTSDEPPAYGSAYMAISANGEFANIPTGDWDFVLYADGYVRAVIPNLSFPTCGGPFTQRVTLSTLDELTRVPVDAGLPAVDARPAADGGGATDARLVDAATTPDAAGGGDFEVIGYRNTDGTIGSGAAGAQIKLSGSKTLPTIGWSFSGAAALLVSTLQATTPYGIVSNQDQYGDPIPFPSPVAYGNYAVANTHPYAAATNPAPALATGGQYTLTMQTVSSQVATLSFRVF